MRQPTLHTPAPSAECARARIDALVAWAEGALDLLSSAFQGGDDEELAALAAADGVAELPAAYDQLLRRLGRGGPGTAAAELFPGDLVDLDAMLPSGSWVGGTALAAEILDEHAVPVELGPTHLVVRVRDRSDVDYVAVGSDDPVVWTVHLGQPGPTFGCLTGWFEHHIGRAIKRRYPLRDAHFPGLDPELAAAEQATTATAAPLAARAPLPGRRTRPLR